MKIRRHIWSLLAAVPMVIGATACSDDMKYTDSEVVEENPSEDDMVEVTLRFNLKDLENIGTRADDESDDSSDSDPFDTENIDLLIYSVRDENDNVLTQYGQGVVDDDIRKSPAYTYYGYNDSGDYNQTLMYASWTKQADGTYNLNQKISLRVMRNKVYKFSCWVQSSQSTAYDFHYLTAVKINYENALNNDVQRDAFCSTSIFSVGQINSDIDITLTRPCAQINVGVDAEANDKGDNLEKYTKSQITLNGVATYFNVVENRAWSAEDYARYKDDEDTFGKNYNENIFANADYIDGKPVFTTNATFKFNEIEEIGAKTFSLNNYAGWSGDKPNKKTYDLISRCFVFVPEAEYNLDDITGEIEDSATAGDADPDEVESGVVSPTLKHVYIYLRAFSVSDDNESNEVFYPKNGENLELEVKRNWRTNLLFKNWKHLLTGNPDQEVTE